MKKSKIKMLIAISCMFFLLVIAITLPLFEGKSNNISAYGTTTYLAYNENKENPDIVINEIHIQKPEWIELYNNDSISVCIDNWKITDQDNHIYEIPSKLEDVPTGRFIVIYTSSGEDDYNFEGDNCAHLYMGRGKGIWNDNGDDVLLIDAKSENIDYVACDDGKDVDPCPNDLTWVKDGTGNGGNAPNTSSGSICLTPNGEDNDHASRWYIAGETIDIKVKEKKSQTLLLIFTAVFFILLILLFTVNFWYKIIEKRKNKELK